MQTVTGAENVVWDLSDLYPSVGDDGLGKDLATIEERSKAFSDRWYGKIASLSIADFMTMVEEYEQLSETYIRMGSFVNLMYSTDSNNAEYGRMLQRVREVSARASSHTVFFTVQITQLSDERLQQLLDAPEMATRRHWLEGIIEEKAHMLTEDGERVMSAKANTSRSSWVRLHDVLMNGASFNVRGEEMPLASVSRLMFDADRDLRKDAADALSLGLAKDAEQHAYVFNTIIADCEATDELRKYPTWISSRNMSNEVSDAAVETLIQSVVKRYDLVHRAYGLKKRLLGLDTFYDYDRNAAIGSESRFWTWQEAKDIVIETYASFDKTSGEIAAMFFDKNWIHAPVQKGKRSGAYAAPTCASAHPYLFTNFTGTSRDVETLAHEMGHGIHQYLSRSAGSLLMYTPLTVAETASVFGEMLTFKKLMESATTKEEKLALMMSKIDGMVNTIFRQIALNRFEHAMHTTRRAEGELSVAQINDIWLRTQSEQFGEAVVLRPGYETWWSYISHFISTPGYVYAYSFGELLVLALYERYQQDPVQFVPAYMDLLAAGGSNRPEHLLAPLGVDITDPTFWNQGLAVVERFIAEAEQLAAQ